MQIVTRGHLPAGVLSTMTSCSQHCVLTHHLQAWACKRCCRCYPTCQYAVRSRPPAACRSVSRLGP